jgi:hypothetical protein
MARKPPKTAPPGFTFGNAVHLVQGSSAGGTLRQSGARFVVPVRDWLVYGPSSSNPIEHRTLRTTFWSEVLGPDSSESQNAPIAADELEAIGKAFPSGLPLVLWSGENWGERLFLWWALDALSRSSLAHQPLWLASPLLIPDWDFLERMGCYLPDQMKVMFGRAQRLGPGSVKAASARWRHFCASTPRGLSELAAPEEPWLKVSADYHRLFPRVSGNALRISEFDEALLTAFSSRAWRVPLALVSPDRLTKHPVLLNHGDLLPRRRLDEWTEPRPVPVLVRRATGVEHGWKNYEYRLTPHGVRVLKHGLGSNAWAPPIAMGGHAAYDTKRPWAVRQTRGAQGLRPL